MCILRHSKLWPPLCMVLLILLAASLTLAISAQAATVKSEQTLSFDFGKRQKSTAAPLRKNVV